MANLSQAEPQIITLARPTDRHVLVVAGDGELLGLDPDGNPYYTTKLINKMRLFNLFKMGSKRLKHDEKDHHKN